MSMKNVFKNKVALPLTMALSIAASPVTMAENSANNCKSSGSNVSHPAYAHRKMPISREAYNASKQLGVVGVSIVKTPDVEESAEEIKELVIWLLEEQGITNHCVVTDQEDHGTTNFRIFVAKRVKQYTFGDIEDGMKIAKEDLADSIIVDEYDRKIINGEVTPETILSLTSLNND